RFFPTAARGLFSAIWTLDSTIRQTIRLRLDLFFGHLARRYEGPSNLLSRTRPLGSMVMWVAALLATYLFLSFVR
ncbi:MAG: Na(+)/H(+) antiporter subunit D, partial [Gammaproteobacteria bacterium]|nr:Na(+)/H(+) antiporter subunit D [Gammaproteobacteria bacterium]